MKEEALLSSSCIVSLSLSLHLTRVFMMARLSEHGIRLSSMSPTYLESNSTSHTWPFSAVAELTDNASDPGVTAKNIWIDVLTVGEQLCLSFMDNGSGMTPNRLHKMLSFGFTEKGSAKGSHKPIGVYGNGFKSGSMRLGRDALIFTKNGGCQSVGMLSQSFLQAINAQAVIVPIAPFNQQTKTLVVTEDSEASLGAILKYSLFHTVSELEEQLDSIQGKKGTKIIIWNIRRNKDGKPEFDFDTDTEDIRLPEIYSEEAKEKWRRDYYRHRRESHSTPEMEFSLRAYLRILYLKPRIQIILRQRKVQTKLVAKSLSMIENDVYKPHFINERVKITFGFNGKNKEHYGIMMYHQNRLIKAYEKVGCQIKSSGQRSGVGVIGVIECNFLKPAHNKQDFEYTKEYRLTLAALGLKLNDYWHEKKEKKAKERAFQALERKNKDKDAEESEEDGEDDEEGDEEEDEEEEVDVMWIQCEECLKWRGIATHLFSGNIPDPFRCSMHPLSRLRSCLLPEDTEENVSTASYEKTFKKQEQASVKRGRSLELKKSSARPLCRVLSEPTTETKQDEVTVSMETQVTDDDGAAATEEEESSPSPRKRRKEASSHDELWKLSSYLDEIADMPTRHYLFTETTETNNQIHKATEKETTDTVYETSKAETTDAIQKPSETETTDQINEDPEKETTDKSQKESETNTPAAPGVNTASHEELVHPEAAALESPAEPQTSHGPPQPRNPHHPLSPHAPVAQTVVVTPLSRPGFQPVSPLPVDGSDRAALSHRLAQLEREAKRLKRILGMRETVMEVATVTDGESSDLTMAEERPACADSGSREQNVGRRTSGSNLDCQRSDEQVNSLENGPESISKDELYWSKTCAKLQTENQTLLTDLDKIRTERDQLLNQMSQTEINERRDQSTNTPNHTYNSTVTLDRLRSIRYNVVALMSSILPNLDMQGISFDTVDVDNILQQIIQANNL
ncbi:MORC family CW-type zinc finger protein 3 isoform X1 [Triplophysa rosa]|uniref:MORC family CW-type zinc finger protein 3 isoform X1 n=1 Tax=Triplophysa rosa TaxID=992332 RepID=UPI002545CB3F|nr:MORC family CW-type zinc finger protein 3 isoform X1 [Triplophysa rosa]